MSTVNFGTLDLQHMTAQPSRGTFTATPQRPRRAPLSRGALNFTNKLPARIAKDSWYFIEDNLIEDGMVALTKHPDGHGEARCSSPTSRLLNASDDARRCLVGHYGDAAAVMPQQVLVDVKQWAPAGMNAHRVAMDPVVALREGVDQLLAEMVAMSAKAKVTEAQRQDAAVRYARLRDRMAFMRDSFVHMEGAFELMQDKLVDLLDDGD